MKRLLLPLVLLLLGLGGGVGAALVLAPAAEPEAAEPLPNPCGEGAGTEAEHTAGDSDGGGDAAPDEEAEEGETAASDYVRLNNQFVVPLLAEGRVASLAMVSLSVETPAGKEEEVLLMEPKLRDIFLQVLFDHANTGGFDGLYTAQSAMRELRGSLLSAAQDEVGALITDVLITDIVRQDQ